MVFLAKCQAPASGVSASACALFHPGPPWSDPGLGAVFSLSVCAASVSPPHASTYLHNEYQWINANWNVRFICWQLPKPPYHLEATHHDIPGRNHQDSPGRTTLLASPIVSFFRFHLSTIESGTMLALLNRDCMVSSDRQLYGNFVPDPRQIITYYWKYKKPGTQINKLKKGWRFGSCWWFLRSHGQISSNYKELCSKSSESLYFSHWGYPNILPPGIVLLRCHDQLILGFVGSRRSWELCGVNEGSWKICKGWQNVLEKLWPGIVLEPNNLAMRERGRAIYIIYNIYIYIRK